MTPLPEATLATKPAPALTRTLHIDGMTCGSCAAKVAAQLEALPEVERAAVDKATDTATVTLAYPTAASRLQQGLDAKYRIREAGAPAAAADAIPPAPPPAAQTAAPTAEPSAEPARGWLATYRPLLTVVGLIALVTVLAQAPLADGLDGRLWMRHFMAGFFVVFAGFKLLDVRGFADSYRMYDIVAARVPAWGYVYPFVELALGLMYLTDVAPFWTNVATVVVLGVSAVGVIRSVLDDRAIKCACLGTGFDLPMSTVTIVEDVSMVAMAAWMLLSA